MVSIRRKHTVVAINSAQFNTIPDDQIKAATNTSRIPIPGACNSNNVKLEKDSHGSSSVNVQSKQVNEIRSLNHGGLFAFCAARKHVRSGGTKAEWG